jgi:hypothetical protein
MADENKKVEGEDLIKAVEAANKEANNKQLAQEQIEFEKELKEKLRENGKLLGVTFSPNEGVPSMVNKLKEAREQLLQDPLIADVTLPADKQIDELTARKNLRLDMTRLVRVQIACLNPAKAELPGEIFTVHNDVVGTVKKFVPYNEAGEAYHIPFFLYKFLTRKKYLQIKDPPKGSRAAPTTKMVPEFSIRILDPLTPTELKELARAQGAAEAAAD